MEKQSHFAIINMKTASTATVSIFSYLFFFFCILDHVCFSVLPFLFCHLNISPQLLVLSQVDKVLDEVDWLIAKMKNQTSDKSGSGKKTLFSFQPRE